MKWRFSFISLARIMFGSLLIAAIACVAGAQEKPAAKPEYKPSEVQELKLKNKQLELQLLYRDMMNAQQRVQSAMADLQKEGEDVRKENKWPESVKFDAQTLAFREAAPAKPAVDPPKPSPAANGGKN